MIKVLLADDSGFMRLLISDILSTDNQIKVVSTAENGKEAYEKVLEHDPDVVVLDITMPEYDGLYAVNQIMTNNPKPIIILSALGNSNPNIVFDAIDQGAFEFINKPTGAYGSNIRDIDQQLIETVKNASTTDILKLKKRVKSKNTHAHTFDQNLAYSAIIIGASTGGTGSIEKLLLKLPSNLPLPIIIAQHMPKDFISSFTKRLDELMPFDVCIAEKGATLKKGVVYIAPGDSNLILKKKHIGNSIIFDFTDKKYKEYNYPSVDALMESAAEVYQQRAIGVILTGMGKDGTEGLLKMKKAGALTIAQDEKTSVVWGMPGSAFNAGATSAVLPDSEIPGYIVSAIS